MKVGDIVRYTRAHGQSVGCWAIVERSDGWVGNKIHFHGHIISGCSPKHWRVGSPCRMYDPPEVSSVAPIYEVIPEDEVPDAVWASLAKYALLGETNS